MAFVASGGQKQVMRPSLGLSGLGDSQQRELQRHAMAQQQQQQQAERSQPHHFAVSEGVHCWMACSEAYHSEPQLFSLVVASTLISIESVLAGAPRVWCSFTLRRVRFLWLGGSRC
jgi:hypothetical protein